VQQFAVILSLTITLSSVTLAAEPSALATQGPKPKAIEPIEPQELEASIERGVEFLLARQNENGSWGSHRTKRATEVLAPVPGSHHAFRGAVTSLCISAVLETGLSHPETPAAIDRAEAWMFEHLPHVRRATPQVMYNVWAHAYSLQAIARLIDYRKDDPAKCEQLLDLARQQLKMLETYEVVDGGWAYYDFYHRTKKPGGSSISFVTAAVLLGMYEIQEKGVEIPKHLVERGMESIRRQRKSDCSYAYGEYLKMMPMRGINRPGGSLGRSQSCNLAMRIWGDETITDEILKTWLNRLYARNVWLDIGRKRPIPHESWMQVAGYFYYFGHYYAGFGIDQLPKKERPHFQHHLARILIDRQEKDGSWWDFPLYDYHQQYGTAMSLMALKRCRVAAAEE